MCRSQRSFSSVLMTASPTAPPKFRIRLKRPEAFFSRSGGSVPSASIETGIIATISPTPRTACGMKSSAKAQSLGDRHQLQAGDRERAPMPTAIMMRGSAFCAMRPLIGAVRT